MALYTPPSLPRTPFILCPTRSSLLPTPPMSAALPRLLPLPRPRVTTLPPIAHFDRHLATMLPGPYPCRVTPSTPVTPPHSRDASLSHRQSSDQPLQQHPMSPHDASRFIDWFDTSLKRSTSFVAEKTCEMVCYLWFSSAPPSSTRSRSQMPSPPYSPDSSPSSSPLQFSPSPTFVHFMQKLLETTQVSQSVIVLSLHYIWCLKERNRFTAGLPGSEFRIAVAALMMANKFLDEYVPFVVPSPF